MRASRFREFLDFQLPENLPIVAEVFVDFLR
jgi:hypothetical protein